MRRKDPASPRPDLDGVVVAPIVDSGSFTHGFCPLCGWRGPARRARSRAAGDVEGHVCPVALTGDLAAPALAPLVVEGP